MTTKIIRVLLVIAVLLLTLLTPVQASTSDILEPSSTMSIIKVNAYQNCLVLGDEFFVVQVNIPYTVAPATPSSAAFLGRLLDNTGAEVVSVPITTYYNNGYSYNTFALYLDSTTVIPWLDATYSMVLSGSPTLNWLGNAATTAMSGYVNSGGADKTAEANSAAANDMALLTGVLSSASYFGRAYNFNKVTVNIGTPGAGAYTTVWEYWNGSGWSPLTGVTDGTSYFMGPAGNHDVTFTIPTNWASTIVAPVAASQMWVRVRVDSYTSMGTPPLGTQSWVNGNNSYPNVSIPSGSFIWNTSATIAATQNIVYSQTIMWADTLSAYWSLLLTSLAGNIKVLSSYGQTYFIQVAPYLQQISPRLFATTVSVPKYVDKTKNTTGAAAVTATWPFDWSGISSYFGFTGTDMVFRTVIAFVGVFFITSIVAAKSIGAAIPVAFFLLVAFAVIGWISPILVAGITFVIVLVFGLVFILGKPTT